MCGAMRLRSAGRTDVGRRRPHNEDAFLVDDELGLYVVCDGVGGNAKGEVASAESVELVHSWVKRWRKTLEAFVADPTKENENLVRRLLESAVQSACYMVFGMGEQDPRTRGMSSTLSLAAVCGPDGVHRPGGRQPGLPAARAAVRAADRRPHAGELPAEAGPHHRRRRRPTPRARTSSPGRWATRTTSRSTPPPSPLEPGDRFLLCSDGLHGYLEERRAGRAPRGRPPRGGRPQLIAVANQRGGRDNITVVVATSKPSCLVFGDWRLRSRLAISKWAHSGALEWPRAWGEAFPSALKHLGRLGTRSAGRRQISRPRTRAEENPHPTPSFQLDRFTFADPF